MNQIEEARTAIEREDYDAAMRLLRPLAENGLAEAQYLLGSLYFTGAEVDARESHDWLRRAADQGHATATYDIARWHDDTVFPPPSEDYYRCMLLRAAELGSVDAWGMLGCSYATGENGFPRDWTLARQWYLRGAEAGDPYSEYNYGSMLHYGEGGPADPQAGLEWIRRAAAGGETCAIHFLSKERHVTRVPLLTVEDTSWIQRSGVQLLILRLQFPVPPGWNARGWNQRTERVIVIRPDARELEATAQINMTHLNIRDPDVPVQERWRVTMWLTDRTPEEVPIGSIILVSPEVRDAILPTSVT